MSLIFGKEILKHTIISEVWSDPAQKNGSKIWIISGRRIQATETVGDDWTTIWWSYSGKKPFHPSIAGHEIWIMIIVSGTFLHYVQHN